MRKFLISVLAVLIWTAAAGQGARYRTPPSAQELQQRLTAISQEKASVQRKLVLVKKKERAVTAQLNAAEEKLEQASHRLSDVSQQLALSRGKLKQARHSLAASESTLDRHQRALSERLELIYQRGETGLLEILFQASSLSDLENRLYLLDQFMAQDVALLNGYEKAKEDREEAALQAGEDEALVRGLKVEAAVTHAQAAEERKNTAALKRRILRERVIWERALAELEQNSREVEALLQRLQTTSAGRERLSRPFTGGFLRPVSGPVVSGFGYRIHPIFRVRKMHTGVDISAPQGTPIRAAAGGVVVHSDRWGGYGKCVIIDHGGGVATLYAHCSSLAAFAGQEVRQGQIIGYVGSTGLSTGPHLHFEVRRNGRPVNPGG